MAEVCLLNILATRAKIFITKMIKDVGLPGLKKRKNGSKGDLFE